MKKMLPEGAVRQKMKMDNFTDVEIDAFFDGSYATAAPGLFSLFILFRLTLPFVSFLSLWLHSHLQLLLFQLQQSSICQNMKNMRK
jgi:hypothetical protein